MIWLLSRNPRKIAAWLFSRSDVWVWLNWKNGPSSDFIYTVGFESDGWGIGWSSSQTIAWGGTRSLYSSTSPIWSSSLSDRGRSLYANGWTLAGVAVYVIPGKPGILDIALYGISSMHGSRYNPLRLPLPDVGIEGTLYHHPSHAR